MARRARWLLAGALLASCSWGSLALADDVEREAAIALLGEGVRLLAAGQFAEACPKLALADRVLAGVGSASQLGDCWEKAGRKGRAWLAFRVAEERARAGAQPDQELVARARREGLETDLGFVTIVGGSALVEVRVAGQAVPQALWPRVGAEPGAVEVGAWVGGRAVWTTTVTITKSGTMSVALPAGVASSLPGSAPSEAPAALATTAPSAPPSSAPAASAPAGSAPSAGSAAVAPSAPLAPSRSELRPLPVLALASGVAAAGLLGVAAGFGLDALAKKASSDAGCRGNVCTFDAAELRFQAREAATVSTALFAIGGAAGAAAVGLGVATVMGGRGGGFVGVGVSPAAVTWEGRW
jgi:hypothetical protein